MRVPKFAWVAVWLMAAAQAQQVTDTKLVDAGKNQQLLRKINGRWWSQDNREVYPPSKGGVFWELDSKPGVVEFYHHRPFQVARAESLHLWMSPDEVKAALGEPNRILGRDGHGFWYYYASNGTKVEVRFMDGGLGEAKYTAVGEKSWPVASIDRELAGRDIYKLLQERAVQKSDAWLANKQATRREAPLRGSLYRHSQPSTVMVDAAEPAAPRKKTIVSSEAVAAVMHGATREDVLSRLGEPSSRFSIAGDEGVRESFTYHLESGDAVVIRLVDGKVVK
ncbi:MAG: hypothetical protein M3O35_19320 [Acidobacteriota bacterium]|nr:hypothetical protein [Acidobacteriota bacterium]